MWVTSKRRSEGFFSDEKVEGERDDSRLIVGR